MSKTIEKLIKRAEVKGEAILNGRMVEWSPGYNSKGDLEEKYAITNKDNIVTLRHWGTETLRINIATEQVISWYGESNSDRDSMNYVLSYYGVPGYFRYRPSIEEFTYNN